MERNIDMKEVSDGKLYTSNDMVKADCGGCEGCSACCPMYLLCIRTMAAVHSLICFLSWKISPVTVKYRPVWYISMFPLRFEPAGSCPLQIICIPVPEGLTSV